MPCAQDTAEGGENGKPKDRHAGRLPFRGPSLEQSRSILKMVLDMEASLPWAVRKPKTRPTRPTQPVLANQSGAILPLSCGRTTNMAKETDFSCWTTIFFFSIGNFSRTSVGLLEERWPFCRLPSAQQQLPTPSLFLIDYSEQAEKCWISEGAAGRKPALRVPSTSQTVLRGKIEGMWRKYAQDFAFSFMHRALGAGVSGHRAAFVLPCKTEMHAPWSG